LHCIKLCLNSPNLTVSIVFNISLSHTAATNKEESTPWPVTSVPLNAVRLALNHAPNANANNNAAAAAAAAAVNASVVVESAEVMHARLEVEIAQRLADEQLWQAVVGIAGNRTIAFKSCLFFRNRPYGAKPVHVAC
jgi:hypothetical protein